MSNVTSTASPEQKEKFKKKLEKLARMINYGIEKSTIAQSMGVSESRISQILKTDVYLKVSEEVAAEKFEENEIINRGWDGIEALGIRQVVNALKQDPDPEFALKASMAANKASRRGGGNSNGGFGNGFGGVGGIGGNNGIGVNGGVKAVITLNASFVQKIENNFEIKEDEVDAFEENKKDTNFLGAKAVQDLLSSGTVLEGKEEYRDRIELNVPQDEGNKDQIQEMLAGFKG